MHLHLAGRSTYITSETPRLRATQAIKGGGASISQQLGGKGGETLPTRAHVHRFRNILAKKSLIFVSHSTQRKVLDSLATGLLRYDVRNRNEVHTLKIRAATWTENHVAADETPPRQEVHPLTQVLKKHTTDLDSNASGGVCFSAWI